MSSPSLPDFERTVELSQGNLDAAELAECHGLLCGLMACGTAGTAGDFLDHLAAMQLLVDPGETLQSIMIDAWERTGRQMAFSMPPLVLESGKVDRVPFVSPRFLVVGAIMDSKRDYRILTTLRPSRRRRSRPRS